MCSEGNYKACHRHYLLAPILIDLGIKMLQVQKGRVIDPGRRTHREDMRRVMVFFARPSFKSLACARIASGMLSMGAWRSHAAAVFKLLALVAGADATPRKCSNFRKGMLSLPVD